MRLFIAATFAFLLLLPISAAPAPALAQPRNEDLLGVEYGEFTGLGRRDPRETVGSVIRIVLSVLGIIALAFILYAGFTWMTAGGNEERVTMAKKTLSAAVIGLVIILSAYAITNFVLKSLYQASTGYQYVE